MAPLPLVNGLSQRISQTVVMARLMHICAPLCHFKALMAQVKEPDGSNRRHLEKVQSLTTGLDRGQCHSAMKALRQEPGPAMQTLMDIAVVTLGWVMIARFAWGLWRLWRGGDEAAAAPDAA